MQDAEGLARKFEVLARVPDERTPRLVAAAEAEAVGFGGVTALAQASGLSRGTVIRGLAEIKTVANRMGHHSHRMAAELLHAMDYSLQSNRKTLEGSSHPDRDAQFHHIDGKIRGFQAERQPVISVRHEEERTGGRF